MRLIGMLDSPYVRRVAISLELLGVPFKHEPLSVFRAYEEFRKINPLVKAPTLVCDDGEVLMDSSLILQFIESLQPGKSLFSSDPNTRQHEFRIVGLALAACDKAVQVVYERNQRPKELQYEPWMDRVIGQMLAGFSELEKEMQTRASLFSGTVNQATLFTAVVWRFTQAMLPGVVPVADFPLQAALSERMEATAVFKKYLP